MRILIGILMLIAGSLMYIKGETKTKWLGESKKEFKYMMGIPIGLIYGIYSLFIYGWVMQSLIALLLPMLTYFIACEIGYGDKNPLTKWVGKRWAITIHGTALGLASLAIIQWWCILAGIISGTLFWYLAEWDNAGKIKEPFIAIYRALGALWLILFF